MVWKQPIKPGDRVIFKKETFTEGIMTFSGVVESVDGDMVDLGVNGRYPIEEVEKE